MEKHLNSQAAGRPDAQGQWVAWRVRQLLAEVSHPSLARLQACVASALSELKQQQQAIQGPLASWRTWRTRRQGLRFEVGGQEVELRIQEIRGARVQLELRAPAEVAVSWIGRKDEEAKPINLSAEPVPD